MAEISNEDLIEYLRDFNTKQKVDIYEQMLNSQIVKKALDFPEVKLILSSVVEMITSDVLFIVTTCVQKEPEEAAKLVYPKCYEINLAYKLLAQWGKFIKKEKKNG